MSQATSRRDRAADQLRRVALYRRVVLVAIAAIDVRLVVNVGFDVAAVVGGPGICEVGYSQDFLGAGRVDFVATEVAAATWHLM